MIPDPTGIASITIPKRFPVSQLDFKKTSHKMLLTGNMQGCRILVTNEDQNNFRVYHDPYDNNNEGQNYWGLNPIATLEYDEYNRQVCDGTATAFAFMYYDVFHQHWRICYQTQCITGYLPKDKVPRVERVPDGPFNTVQCKEVGNG